MSQEEQPKVKTVKPRRKPLWNPLSLFLVLLLLTLIVIVGAGFWRVFNLNSDTTTILSSFSQQIEAEHQQITLLQNKLATAEKQLQQQAQAFQAWRRSLQKGHDYAQVLNAQYWVQRATDYILLTSDVPRALSLLGQAREELKGLIDPRISLLQKALDEDLVALKNVPWVDSGELYLRLISLQQQVTNLPLTLVPTQNKIILPTPGTMPTSTWEKGWQSFTDALRQLVVVYHSPTENTHPFITPDEGPYIRQNIIAALNSVMWAVLYRDNSIYHASLQQANRWVEQYGDPNEAATKTMLSQLQTLQVAALHPAKTLVLASPSAFEAYLKTI